MYRSCTRLNDVRWLMAALCLVLCGLPEMARAHFSYSDPRIVHVVEQDEGKVVIMERLPAPLLLLPEDWKGAEETRLPPFAVNLNGNIVLNSAALARNDAALRDLMRRSLTISIGGAQLDPRIEQYRFWVDDARPRFGTRKSAMAAFDEPNNLEPSDPLPYFNLTVDVLLSVPVPSLSEAIDVSSDLGRNFDVMDKFGTVVKLHRNDNTETKASMGVLEVSFPSVSTKGDILTEAALTGAEHIYRGLDHLAMILLIAIAAINWRQALSWASAFTLGHMTTLAAGIYGIAPSAIWFVPVVELAIALSIIGSGVAVFLRHEHRWAWAGLLVIGLIHGYGFAASASEGLFAGQFDPLELVAFAIGLEICQFAIYALALPTILVVDRSAPQMRIGWRRAIAISVALAACFAAVSRLFEASGTFGIT